MALVVTDDKHYKNIADTLRMLLPPWSPDEGEDNPVEPDYTMRPSDMWMWIIDCYNDGFDLGFESGMEDGFSEGYSTGHAEGVEEGKAEGREEGYTEGKNEGITEGKQAEYDRFWDAYQDNGKRTQYLCAFSGFSWTEKIFLPKYPLRLVGSCGSMFQYSSFTDLKAHMETNGIVIDTSQATVLETFFRGSTITRYGTLDCTGATNLTYVLYGAKYLKHIDKVIIKSDGSQTVSNFAINTNELEDITIEGVFGQTGLSFQQSTKLSKASITSVVNALSTTTSGLSVTFSKTAVNNAFTTDEWSVLAATKSNWTINLV